ncbi:MAG: hypothetical protein HZC36_09880 [Armatimonadetes bacterium]|nr:hypothetical protein [Armatimonadota bacterium]
MIEIPLHMAEEVERRAPEFVDLVQQAGKEPIKVSLDSFSFDSRFLHTCLLYAACQRKRVLFEFGREIEKPGTWGNALLKREMYGPQDRPGSRHRRSVH